MCWCVGPIIITLLGVDDVKFSFPEHKFCECNCEGYVLVLVPGKNTSKIKAPIDEALDEIYGILITETPEFIDVPMVYELNANHVLYGLLGMFYINID